MHQIEIFLSAKSIWRSAWNCMKTEKSCLIKMSLKWMRNFSMWIFIHTQLFLKTCVVNSTVHHQKGKVTYLVSEPFQIHSLSLNLKAQDYWNIPLCSYCFLRSLMAMAEGRCDLYFLLLVTLFQAVPNILERKGYLLQHTAEILVPLTDEKICR